MSGDAVVSPLDPICKGLKRRAVMESGQLRPVSGDDDGLPSAGSCAWHIVRLLRDEGRSMTAAELSEEIGVSEHTAIRRLKAMEMRGLAIGRKIYTGHKGRPATSYEWSGNEDAIAAHEELGRRLFRMPGKGLSTRQALRIVRESHERG